MKSRRDEVFRFFAQFFGLGNSELKLPIDILGVSDVPGVMLDRERAATVQIRAFDVI